MKILVLGGHGFLGSNLRFALESRGYEVTAASRRDGLDLLDTGSVSRFLRNHAVDAIFNCAAHVGSIHYVMSHAAQVAHDNMQMALNLYREVSENAPHAHIVNPLSNCSYPGDADIQCEKEWWSGEVHHSVYAYGNSKRFIYVLSKCYQSQHAIRSTNLLVPNAFGVGDHLDTQRTHAVSGMIVRMLEAQGNGDPRFEVWGSGRPVREWGYIADVAEIMARCLEVDSDLTDPVNIAQNRGVSIRETAETIRDAIGYSGELWFNDTMEDGAPRKVLDDSRFSDFFPGFKFTDHAEAIRRTVDYYRAALKEEWVLTREQPELDVGYFESGTHMKILVTGGAGYVGTTLIPQLLEQGHEVRVLDNLMFGGDPLLPFFRYKTFEFQKGDIRNAEDVRRAAGDRDVVVHLAAIVGYPACRQQPRLAEEVNIHGTENVAAAVSRDQLVLFGSTGSNYGAVEEICTESTPLHPLSLYGQTKTRAESHLLENCSAVAFRFATAFGLSPRLRLDLLINDFAYRAVTEQYLVVYEKTFMRTFIHVHDMGRAFMFAVDHSDKMRGEIFNVGSDLMNYSKQEICEKIQKHVECYVHYADVGEDADKRNYVVSYKKVNEVGYSTLISVEDGVRELLRAFDVIRVGNPYRNA